MDQRGILTTYKLPNCCDRFKIVQSFIIAIWLWFGGNFEFERFSIKDLLRPFVERFLEGQVQSTNA